MLFLVGIGSIIVKDIKWGFQGQGPLFSFDWVLIREFRRFRRCYNRLIKSEQVTYVQVWWEKIDPVISISWY